MERKTVRTGVFGVATLLPADAPSAADDIPFGYREGDLAMSVRVARLYDRLETHSGRACAIYGVAEIAYRESCLSDFVDDFVVGADDPVLLAGR